MTAALDPLRDPADAWDSPLQVVPDCRPSAFFAALGAANERITELDRVADLLVAAANQLELWRGGTAMGELRDGYLAELIPELRSAAKSLEAPR